MTAKLRLTKMAIICLLILLPLAPLSSGCGGASGGRVVITIGEINDFTGPAAPAVFTLHWALQDMVKYYNEEGLIPGVKLKLVAWDDRYDPSREVPGYDWLRGHGADVIVTIYSMTGIVLKPFADRDKFPICSLSTDESMLEPPGWVLCIGAPRVAQLKTFLKWIHDVDWDYSRGIPKIGQVGWDEISGRIDQRAFREYSQDHPDQIEYVGSRLAPVGQMTWGAEVEALKGCDYIQVKGGTAGGALMKEFHERGYSARFFDDSLSSYRGFLVDQLGWEVLDGVLSPNISLMWSERIPIVDLANELVCKYHSKAEAESAIRAGLSYPGGIQNAVIVFQILETAIKAVGAENFSSQAFYDAAAKYKTGGSLWEGYPQWSFSETKRYLVDHIAIYKFDASVKDLVWVGGWLPLVLE